jgi:plastocyanin
MISSWSAGLAATLAVSHILPQFAAAQDYVSSALRSVSPTPTASESVESSSATPTSSGEPTVYTIKAGSGGFKFDPPELHNVSVGDIVKWEFYPRDHSVARAEFGSACVPYEYTGKDKVGFWSETQWVNNTNEVCLQVRRHDGYTNKSLAHILQRYDQLDRTYLLLLRSTGLMFEAAHGRRHQSEFYANPGIASSCGGRSRLSGSTW